MKIFEYLPSFWQVIENLLVVTGTLIFILIDTNSKYFDWFSMSICVFVNVCVRVRLGFFSSFFFSFSWERIFRSNVLYAIDFIRRQQ